MSVYRFEKFPPLVCNDIFIACLLLFQYATTNTGNRISLLLMIDYIITHELCHFVIKGHI